MRFRSQQAATLRLRFIPHLPIGIGPQVASRMWQVAALIDSRVVKARRHGRRRDAPMDGNQAGDPANEIATWEQLTSGTDFDS